MTKSAPLPTHYDAAQSEATHTEAWEQAGYAKGDPNHPGTPYSIILPPPNVTGSLHMGHALNNTLQDALVRYRRMDGDSVVWIPGFDHASIAVHWVLERKLHAEGKTRKDLGREAFLKQAWAFKEASQKAILAQQKRLGVSCDFDRLAFTLDEPRSHAVREAFVKLYNDGLIYRDLRLVNWDPVSQTSVSDLEVVHDENIKGELYSFAYPLSDGSGELVVATTRPETMLGDTAIAVHPDDDRYKHLIGQTVDHPLVDRKIPIVGDAILVDPAFGTGAVKVTPAHDFNDFAVGKRHKLQSINLLNLDGTLNEAAGPLQGLSVPAARKEIKARLEALGLERGCEVHTMSVGRSERSGAVLEPMLSTQWYVRAKPPGGACGGGHQAQICAFCARGLGEYLFFLAQRHPRLVHLPPAVVGPPNSCLLLRGLRAPACSCGQAQEMHKLRPCHVAPRRRCFGHLVQLRPVALQHPGLA